MSHDSPVARRESAYLEMQDSTHAASSSILSQVDSRHIERKVNHQEEIHPAIVSRATKAEGVSRSADTIYRILKRIFDIVISLFALAVLLIPLAICCVIIVFDSKGAPIFRQRRVGRNGRPLLIFKLRTMYADADDLEKYLTPEQLDQWHEERKVDHDPRVTRVGRGLRRTSFDETPQFLNVLLGQMSVVGPRPVAEEEVLAYGEYEGLFLSVKPGITGYWQVYARDQNEYQSGGRQAMELFYVRNRSMALDLKLFFATFAAIFKMTGQ